jgi:hypothetical protein
MIQQQIASVERGIETKKQQVALNNALERLMKNKDFQKVVLQAYFTTEAVRLVSVKGDPEMQTPERQADVLRDIDGIGSLQRFFTKVERNAEYAGSSVEEDEATLDELREEALRAEGEAE